MNPIPFAFVTPKQKNNIFIAPKINAMLADTWAIHDRINLYLLGAMDDSHLLAAVNKGGRNVGAQFAHMHNVRLMWLKAAAPNLFDGQIKFEKETTLTIDLLKERLTKSSKAIGQLLELGESEGKIKGFKPDPTAFLGYMISHESHHRGQIVLTLKLNGTPLDKKVLFGIWEWGTR